jgi:hypothetical protein
MGDGFGMSNESQAIIKVEYVSPSLQVISVRLMATVLRL